MIYTSDYFDNCNGLIPQIVLSSFLLQAGNERAARYKNQLTTDNSQTTTFSFDGNFLDIDGLLPLAESRYLITQPSLINRIGAINSENAAMFSDIIGLPVGGFERRGVVEVTLPPNIDNLSTAPLVLEKRLAYLVLLLEKRNYLIQLYNYLNYTRLSSEVIFKTNTANPIIGTITPGSGSTSGGSATFTPEVIGIVGWEYGYIISPVVRVSKIVGVCLINLYKTYPDLFRLIPVSGLSDLSDWVVAELIKDDPVLLPPLNFDLLVGNISDIIEEMREQPAPRDPLGVVMNDNQSDVTATITSSSSDGSSNVELPVNSFSERDALPEAVLQDNIPVQDYSSGGGGGSPDNTLPPC